MRLSYKIALGAVFMAIGSMFMAAANILPLLSFALPAIAGAIILPLNILLDKKWALLVYIGVSVISIFIVSDKTAIVSFIVLLGYYPILKGIIESINKNVLEWVIKMLVFNISAAIGVGGSILLFGLNYILTEYAGFTKITILLFILGSNIAFIVYDIALSKFATLTVYKIIPTLRKIK